MCQLKREEDIWWLGSGANRRRDDVEEVKNKRENQEEKEEENEEPIEEVKVVGEQQEKEAEIDGSGDKFFDSVDEENTIDEGVTTPAAQPINQKEKSTGRGVDPSGSLPDYDLLHLQENFNGALKANAQFQASPESQTKPPSLTKTLEHI
ncbi:hypothetical protein Dimus_015799 [Dionaea muscipula]